LIGNSNQRRGGGLALHFSCWDQAEAPRTVGGTPAARIARLAPGRWSGADGEALAVLLDLGLGERIQIGDSGHEPERPNAAILSGCSRAKKTSEPLSAACCCEDAVGYEKLRSCALNGTPVQGGALSVLLHRGLAAWLSATPPPLGSRPSPATMPNPVPLPATLASIILRLTKEAAYA
jgi:hypothetical protein